MAKILMLASEATPFASTGGLAEVMQGLPIALRKAGHEVAMLMPYYPQVRAAAPNHIHRTVSFSLGPHSYLGDVYETEVENVRYFFLDIPSLYNRPGIYGVNGSEYADNHLRFGALARGALAISESLFTPQVIHCHDWHTALLPVLLKESLGTHPTLGVIKTLLTIHNMSFQGHFPRSTAADLGLTDHFATSSAIYPDGTVGFLKGGLTACDAITTVSPTYAAEIQTPAFGCGLELLLYARRAQLHGILNGIDFGVWNPATDPQLVANFSREDLGGKRACKLALLKQCGLPAERLDKLLIGVVARLTDQKGLNLLMRRPQDFVDHDISLVLLGSGEAQQEDFFRWLASAYPNRVSVNIGYSAQLTHRIMAGSDLFLMPSRYEPCGLTQLYAMRYGTLPLVHATGGLSDSVNAEIGFRFSPYTGDAFISCLRGAISLWQTARWLEMQQAAMQQDTSWGKPAAAYSNLYADLLAERNGHAPSTLLMRSPAESN